MKNAFFISLVLFLSLPSIAAAQPPDSSIIYGLVLGLQTPPPYMTNDDLSGLGIEFGGSASKIIGKQTWLTIDTRLSYTRATEILFDFVDDNAFNDDTYDVRRGPLDLQTVSFHLPIRVHAQLFKKAPIFVFMGLSPRLNLWGEAQWEYDVSEYNRNTDSYTFKAAGEREQLRLQVIETGIVAGAGYRGQRWILEAMLVSRSINLYDSDFIGGTSFPLATLNIGYRLD